MASQKEHLEIKTDGQFRLADAFVKEGGHIMDQNLFVDASRPRQKFQFIITLDAAQLRKDRGQVPLLLHGKILLEESQPFKAGMLVIQIDDRRYIFSVKLCWLAKTVHAAKHGFRQERFIFGPGKAPPNPEDGILRPDDEGPILHGSRKIIHIDFIRNDRHFPCRVAFCHNAAERIQTVCQFL